MSPYEFFSSVCELPSLPSVDGVFIQDCDIKPAPDPITACDLPDIQPDPPFNPIVLESLSLPCPDLAASLDLTITGDATGDGGLTVAKRLEECGYDFTLTLNIDVIAPPPLPPICPEISASASITVTGGSGTVSVVATEIADCSYNFEFTFTFALPSVPGGGGSSVPQPPGDSCACLPPCDPTVTYCVPRDARLVVNGCGQIVGWYDGEGTWTGMPYAESASISIPECSSSSSVSVPASYCAGVCSFQYNGTTWVPLDTECGLAPPGFICVCAPPVGVGSMGEIRYIACGQDEAPPPPP